MNYCDTYPPKDFRRCVLAFPQVGFSPTGEYEFSSARLYFFCHSAPAKHCNRRCAGALVRAAASDSGGVVGSAMAVKI